jgi:hypothetical protein
MDNKTTKLQVYLDIDGTILYEPKDSESEIANQEAFYEIYEALDYQFVCDGLEELLEFVVAHCQPFWLSFRTHLGQTKALEERLYQYLPEIARKIPPAYWEELKYEGVDKNVTFVWFEDDVMEGDEAWLQENNLLGSLVRLDPYCRENPRIILAELRRRLAEE